MTASRRALDSTRWVLLVLLCGACTAARPTPPVSVASAIVVREPAYLESAGVAQGSGTIRVAVRAVVRPAEALPQSLVTLLDNRQQGVTRTSTSAAGIATLSNVRAGRYTLRVQRIGHEALDVALDLVAGCAADVEAYLAVTFIGLEQIVVVPPQANVPSLPPAPAPVVRVTGGRATITTCAPEGPGDSA